MQLTPEGQWYRDGALAVRSDEGPPPRTTTWRALAVHSAKLLCRSDAAVEIEHLTGDEGCRGRAEVHGRSGDVLRLGDPAERDAREQLLVGCGIVEPVAGHLRANGMVAGWIATYRERYPAMRVDYVPTDRKLDLIAEHFDLTIRIGPMADSGLRAVVLEEVGVWIVAAASYLARHGTPRKPAELARHEWIALSLLPAPWSIDFARGGRKVRVKLRGSISAASTDAVLQLVIQGAGISAFPGTADLRGEVEAGRLVRLFPGWTTGRMFLYAAYPGSIAAPAKTRAFIDLAKEAVRSPTP